MVSAVNGQPVSRKAKAAVTKRRIIEAASSLFVTNGYHGSSMAMIAERAGVAVQTVYFVFHTKSELFAAALDAAVLGPEGRPPMEQGWAEQAASATGDPAAALQAFVRGAGPILERASALSEVARAAAATDPDLAEIYRSREVFRVEGYRAFVDGLNVTDVAPAYALDVLLTLHSARVYLAFREGRGWSHAEVIEWMAQTIPGLVLPAP
ncbi:TetR/AcrR family transcriptional regulator [Georgenia sp. Marseille-Q6866]